MRRRSVDLSPAALVRAGVTGLLLGSIEAASARSWTIAASRIDGMPPDDAEPKSEPDLEDQSPVAVVRVLGPLRQRATMELCEGYTDGYDAIEARFMSALRPGVTDVVVVVDSPGGDRAGCFASVRRMRAAADRAGVRVWTVADECAASGGFALLCLGDRGRVHCPAGGLTASVGVVSTITTVAGALEKEGVAVRVVRSGLRKCKPSGVEPIEDADVAQRQEMVDAAAVEFFAWVSERRGIALSDEVRSGAIMSGSAALAAGLIDGTASAYEVMAMAQAEASLARLREALGLGADASTEQMTARAAEFRAAAETELPAARAKLATADGELVALKARDEQDKAAAAKTAARATFAGEVQALQASARVTPASATAVLAHYDAHGEASARATLALVTSPTPIVLAAGAKPGAVPVPAGGGLTAWEKARAKQLGMSETDYAAAKGGGEAAASE